MTVVLTSLSLDEPPLKSATRMISTTAPPTIHTQGCVYQSVVVVSDVVVVTFWLTVVSCAHNNADTLLNTSVRNDLKAKLMFFIVLVLSMKYITNYPTHIIRPKSFQLIF